MYQQTEICQAGELARDPREMPGMAGGSGTRGEDTCSLTRLPQGSLQNPHGTTQEFRKHSKPLRWQMRTAELLVLILKSSLVSEVNIQSKNNSSVLV